MCLFWVYFCLYVCLKAFSVVVTLHTECSPDKEGDTRSWGLRSFTGTGFQMTREEQNTTSLQARTPVTTHCYKALVWLSFKNNLMCFCHQNPKIVCKNGWKTRPSFFNGFKDFVAPATCHLLTMYKRDNKKNPFMQFLFIIIIIRLILDLKCVHCFWSLTAEWSLRQQRWE